MLAERLVDAGYVMVPATPTCGPAPGAGPQEGRCRGGPHRLPHRPYRFERLRPLVPQGEEAAELRAIARDHERSSRDERRLLNRLRADLIATFPAVVAIAGDDMGRPTFLRLLERWPTANALTSASRRPA
jgi:hypothetical protein